MKSEIEKIDDDALIESIDRHMRNATGGNTNSSDVSKRRENAVYEMSLEAQGDLKPQGVSKIVSSDSAEIAEGYTALLTKLLLDNNKLALFTPYSNDMASVKASQIASDVVNYCLFNSNPDGWSKLSTWIKSAVVFGNSALTWGWEEHYDYVVEEYETIEEGVLDQILSDSNVEVIGDLLVAEEPTVNPDGTSYFSFVDVRLRRKIDKSGVKLRTIPPESFLIDRAASSVIDATFVGIVTEMTRSDVRRTWSDQDIDFDEIGEESTVRSSGFSYEAFARKDAGGIQNWVTNNDDDEDEANISITVVECWIRSDRDGDGIAELKHVIKAGNTILEEDAWIGPNVVLTNARYPQSPNVKDQLSGPIIKKGAKIGANVTILPGLVIVAEALVGAGSVVTKNIETKEVWVGNPAKLIKKLESLPY